jgi:integrase
MQCNAVPARDRRSPERSLADPLGAYRQSEPHLEDSGENSKSKRVRSVPLNDAALEVLESLGTEGKNEYLFINTKTKEPLTAVNTVWGRIRVAAGLPKLRIHDLRHQHASMLVNSGRIALRGAADPRPL